MPILIGLKPNIGHVYLDLLVCFIPVVGMTGANRRQGMPKMAFPPPGAGSAGAPSRAAGDVSGQVWATPWRPHCYDLASHPSGPSHPNVMGCM